MTTRIQGDKTDSASFDKLTNAIDDTAQTAGESARVAIDKGRDVLSQGRAAVSDIGDSAQAYVSRNAKVAYSGARDAAQSAGATTADFVRERPLSALALAVGAGIIGTLLLSRRRR